MINLAHLAREEGLFAEAANRYEQVMACSLALGLVEVQAGALAGAGLVALQGGRAPVARSLALEMAKPLAGRDDWWFQGRELAEALAIRLMLRDGQDEPARHRFERALALAEAHDAFGAAWLVADYADALRMRRTTIADLRPLIARHAARVDELGMSMLATRYAVLQRAALDGFADAAPPVPVAPGAPLVRSA
jgi:hypothetical protein